jgi:hypothetical protein
MGMQRGVLRRRQAATRVNMKATSGMCSGLVARAVASAHSAAAAAALVSRVRPMQL